ncbi:Cys-rich peptide radical SAM maturase CcpM [Clostridium botulinum]|uniref:Cys-rich peptide radical SAM maturase CcpM n=1 Tax=Clostridium botulinum TaxID=1491 RepID=A0A6B4S684_CLOBO|nr:Cys-rich peptide radical SAM maturase CcpM [Clostridium botulinum]NFE59417.1 Cys-rich peptide radical SAM maturase CcpM [Clostridium botulinum]NFE74550.1 Cys-rich peptide radical SAM maturase CcpM [Clostridium botulinum]NFE94786.1 Cys-rich peptide radical SAM maturase CcpM [Clostridium botulinum]NFF88955.1 Cys-rich peptide radical SAM maturase CcpM [Clostridium botulinum]NFG11421.1 Cys-rich peptide radical SAM maturase CcpM [Clostridium botulinum]
MSNKPFIKLFKTNDKYYMYDVNKNVILNISNKQYNFLENCIKNDVDDYIKSKETNKFYEEGFLSSNRPKEIVNISDDLLSHYLENNVKLLTLQITQQCNFRCEYCAYSGDYLNRTHSNKKMSISTALKGIDFLINHSKNNDTVNIAFYGGEPLLEFNFIKQCIEYAEKKADGKNVTYSMTTNGSILNDEIVEFLYKHAVDLTISLDGPKEIHDIHRKFAFDNKGSFDKVINNINNIKKKFPKYLNNIFFNAVIDAENNFSSIDEFFLNCKGIKDIPLTSSLISDSQRKSHIKISDDFMEKTQYELFRIFYYVLRKKNSKNYSRIIIKRYSEILKLSKDLMLQKMLPEKMHHAGPCIPGVQRLFINADGYFYPCEKVSETSDLMQIGHVETGFDISKVKKLLNIGKINEKACKDCWAIRFCGICAAMIDNSEKEFSSKVKEKCCKNAKVSLEEKFKDYCVLREFGYKFDEEEITLLNV